MSRIVMVTFIGNSFREPYLVRPVGKYTSFWRINYETLYHQDIIRTCGLTGDFQTIFVPKDLESGPDLLKFWDILPEPLDSNSFEYRLYVLPHVYCQSNDQECKTLCYGHNQFTSPNLVVVCLEFKTVYGIVLFSHKGWKHYRQQSHPWRGLVDRRYAAEG